MVAVFGPRQVAGLEFSEKGKLRCEYTVTANDMAFLLRTG